MFDILDPNGANQPDDCHFRMLGWNLIHIHQAALTPADGFDQFTSSLAWHPAQNMYSTLRHKRWISKGMYRVYDGGASAMSAFPGRYRLEIAGPTDSSILDFTNGTWVGGQAFAAMVQAKLNTMSWATDTTYNGNWVVTYYDEETTGFVIGGAPNFRFTISNSAGNFSMTGTGVTINASILPLLGFHNGSYGDTDYSGASSYTSDYRACMTEEYLTFNLVYPGGGTAPGRPYTVMAEQDAIDVGETGNTRGRAFTWFALVDTNVRIESTFVNPNDSFGAAPKYLKLFLHNSTSFDSATFVDATDPTALTVPTVYDIGRTDVWSPINSVSHKHGPFFDSCFYPNTLSRGTTGYTHLHEGPSNIMLYRMDRIPIASGPSTGDNQELPGSSAYGTYVRLTISDPTNPAGHVYIGVPYLGPGWTTKRNMKLEMDFYHSDPSVRTRSDNGAPWESIKKTHRMMKFAFGKGNPITDYGIFQWAHQMMAPKSGDPYSLAHMDEKTAWGNIAQRLPFILVPMDNYQPRPVPNPATDPIADHRNTIGRWAQSAMYGRLEKLPAASSSFSDNAWNASVGFVEDPF